MYKRNVKFTLSNFHTLLTFNFQIKQILNVLRGVSQMWFPYKFKIKWIRNLDFLKFRIRENKKILINSNLHTSDVQSCLPLKIPNDIHSKFLCDQVFFSFPNNLRLCYIRFYMGYVSI